MTANARSYVISWIFFSRKVKKFEVIETRCDLELPNSADDVTLRMICFLS